MATSAILQIADESLKCQKESESSFDHKKVVSTAIDAIAFMAKATHSLSAERRDRLKPALNEEVRSLSDLKLAKENYKLTPNLVSTKLRNKVAGPSSTRAGFKRRPDHEAGNSFSFRRPKKDIFIENTTVSEEHQIQEILTACTENDYFLPKLKIYL